MFLVPLSIFFHIVCGIAEEDDKKYIYEVVGGWVGGASPRPSVLSIYMKVTKFSYCGGVGKNVVKIFKFEGCWKMKRQDPCRSKEESREKVPRKGMSSQVHGINNRNHIHLVMASVMLVVVLVFFSLCFLF